MNKPGNPPPITKNTRVKMNVEVVFPISHLIKIFSRYLAAPTSQALKFETLHAQTVYKRSEKATLMITQGFFLTKDGQTWHMPSLLRSGVLSAYLLAHPKRFYVFANPETNFGTEWSYLLSKQFFEFFLEFAKDKGESVLIKKADTV